MALRAFSVFIALSIYISVTVLCLCYSVFVYLWHSVQEGGDWQWVIRSTRTADRQRCNLTSCITAVRMISITIMIILKFWTLIILVPIKIIFRCCLMFQITGLTMMNIVWLQYYAILISTWYSLSYVAWYINLKMINNSKRTMINKNANVPDMKLPSSCLSSNPQILMVWGILSCPCGRTISIFCIRRGVVRS